VLIFLTFIDEKCNKNAIFVALKTMKKFFLNTYIN